MPILLTNFWTIFFFSLFLFRNYNGGIIGTHSDERLYKRYFDRIVFNQQAAVWLGEVSRLWKDNYHKRFVEDLSNAIYIPSPLMLRNYSNAILRLDYESIASSDPVWERYVAPWFGLWHSIPYIRSSYYGVVKVHYKTNMLFIVPSFAHNLFGKPEGRIATGADFLVDNHRVLNELTIVAAPQNENCDQTCSTKSKTLACDANALFLINTCEQLQSHFPCQLCDTSIGSDQPAYVSDPNHSTFGHCLIHSHDPEGCKGHHESTSRLCPCH